MLFKFFKSLVLFLYILLKSLVLFPSILFKLFYQYFILFCLLIMPFLFELGSFLIKSNLGTIFSLLRFYLRYQFLLRLNEIPNIVILLFQPRRLNLLKLNLAGLMLLDCLLIGRKPFRSIA